VMDWRSMIRFEHTREGHANATHLTFGWGEKTFFMETPQWSDLSFANGFRACFGLGRPAVHTVFWYEVKESEKCIKIGLSKAQYRKLVDFLLVHFAYDSARQPINIKTPLSYGPHDAFYEGRGSYHLFHSCNTWVNNALKSCGQKASLWTAFGGGLFYLYRQD
jgi:uncharacterized protein (TIGR02117 family)